jgi:uncharacterized small protein (DUF1192 family)
MMASEIDDIPVVRRDHVLGQDLSTLSIDELNGRIAALRAEIVRLEAEITRKTAHRDAAASVFRL